MEQPRQQVQVQQQVLQQAEQQEKQQQVLQQEEQQEKQQQQQLQLKRLQIQQQLQKQLPQSNIGAERRRRCNESSKQKPQRKCRKVAAIRSAAFAWLKRHTNLKLALPAFSYEDSSEATLKFRAVELNQNTTLLMEVSTRANSGGTDVSYLERGNATPIRSLKNLREKFQNSDINLDKFDFKSGKFSTES